MTETRIHRADKQQNGNAMAETSTVEDVFDDTYREKEGKKPPMVLVWRNIIMMGFLHIGALYGLHLIPSASWLTLGWSAVCYTLSALGVTAGAHRLWSHRSYKASFPLRVFLALCNSMAFQNDIYEWARDHRVHHKYSETDADPHNAKRGFFFSHIGWLLVRKHPDVIEKGRKLELGDLRADRVVMFQRRYYNLSVVLLCFLVPTLVPWYFWGESLAVGYFVPGLLRYTTVLNATWLVNSAAHMWGNRPYDKTINPRENQFVALSAIGPGTDTPAEQPAPGPRRWSPYPLERRQADRQSPHSGNEAYQPWHQPVFLLPDLNPRWPIANRGVERPLASLLPLENGVDACCYNVHVNRPVLRGSISFKKSVYVCVLMYVRMDLNIISKSVEGYIISSKDGTQRQYEEKDRA